ncbi:hypothetical protein WQ54_30780 [Bacillus sp. SA1-12]|nr:hypothetical protein WQ54_30780 [Bacillus sp. SA1-12]
MLALYTEGNQSDKEFQLHKQREMLTSSYWVLHGSLLSLFIGMLLIVYFTELSFVLQMTIACFSLLFSISVTAYFIGKRAFFQVSLRVMVINFLILSLTLTEFYTYGDSLWIDGVVVANCLQWVQIRSLYRLLYIFISSIMRIILFGEYYILTILKRRNVNEIIGRNKSLFLFLSKV